MVDGSAGAGFLVSHWRFKHCNTIKDGDHDAAVIKRAKVIL